MGTTTIVETIQSIEQWENLLSKSKTSTIVVKFTAEWCKPCKKIDSFYTNTLACKYNNNATFVKIDVDALDELAAMYNIVIMPTFLIFCNGKKVDKEFKGGLNEEGLEDYIRSYVNLR